MSLDGKHALITGSSRGIGRGIATQLLDAALVLRRGRIAPGRLNRADPAARAPSALSAALIVRVYHQHKVNQLDL